MRLTISACVLLLCVLAAFPTTAEAQNDARVRDGFDFQFQLGYAMSRTQVTRSGFAGEGGSAYMTGHGVGGGLLFGAFLSERLALGGATLGGHSLSPTISNVKTSTGDFSFNVLGPYVSYYPRPDLGLQILVQVGLGTTAKANESSQARFSGNTRDVVGGGAGLGLGATLGFGYGAWVSDRVELGGMARFQFLRTNASDGPASFRYTAMVPALVGTVSVH